MCEAHAYMKEKGEEVKILENVDEVEVDGDQIRMVNIFGEQKTVKARILRYHTTKGKILLEAVA